MTRSEREIFPGGKAGKAKAPLQPRLPTAWRPQDPSAQWCHVVVSATVLNLTQRMALIPSLPHTSCSRLNRFLKMKGKTHSLRTLFTLKQMHSAWILKGAGIPGFPVREVYGVFRC